MAGSGSFRKDVLTEMIKAAEAPMKMEPAQALGISSFPELSNCTRLFLYIHEASKTCRLGLGVGDGIKFHEASNLCLCRVRCSAKYLSHYT